ncbi:MAG: beta-ketoacyl-ACP synthase III [Alphaproteobacteria bacterium]
MYSVIAGCGSALPRRCVSNAELAETVDTDDAWIRERTGIHQRYIAGEGEFTSGLALDAARGALDHAGVPADDVDLIIVATTTPDDTFPSTATRVQAGLGLDHGAAFDVQAVCSGFIYGLSVADAMIRTGQVRHALVIGAETFSRILDWTDRTTCVLFGDGAGAVVLSATRPNGEAKPRGLLSTHLHSDGRQHDLLYVDGGPSRTQSVGHVRMAGREVFRHAVAKLSESVDEALAANGMAASDVDWLVPHQANRRIIDAVGKKLNLEPDQVVITIDRHANTSAASIPLALDVAVKDGRILPGHVVMLEAMGGGFTWGAALVRW